jgi:TPR repeat protein
MLSSMPLWQRFASGRDRAEKAALEERVTALQAALAQSNAGAGRRTNMRPWPTAAVTALSLALGFVLGVYRAPLQQSIVDLVRPFGFTGPNPDAGFAAFDQGHYATALRLLPSLAERGNARAQSNLGHMYYHGRGVRQDDSEALKWFRRAADQGDAQGQLHVGIMYAEGQAVPQDAAEATKWYRLAADQGDAQAQYNLALAYAKGEGVSQDNVSAYMWFNLAAPASGGRNRTAAVKSRDLVARNMSPSELAEAQTLAREWKPK